MLGNMEAKIECLHQGVRIEKLTLLDSGPFGWRIKARWRCDCGKTTTKEVGSVLRGWTQSCGRCNEISAEDMAMRRFGSLRMKAPAAVTAGSAKKVQWLCDCGKEAAIRVFDVVGRDRTCGHCHDVPIAQISGRKFGKLCLADAKGLTYITPESHRKLTWQCDCGRTTEVQARYVLQGAIGTCGRCNELSAESLVGKKFGRLQMRDPQIVKANSNKKVWWRCDCGREVFSKVFAVTRGKARSCGRCYLSYRQKWEAGKGEIRKLRTPIFPEQLPDWCPVALETIADTSKPFRARCRLCDGEYYPRWSGIRLGKSLTCGCSVSQVSGGQNEMFGFIAGLGIEAELEHKVGDLTYDIWVPSKNLAIEFNGLKWHSRKDSKKRDVAKHANAVAHKCDYLMIFEDEWTLGRSKMENLLRNKLGLNKSTALRPLECEIRAVDRVSADEFYERYHYIGQVKAPVNYGVLFGGELIACCSFKRPTRQSKHDWELVRMVARSDFRVHGIWSKIMQTFVAEHFPASVVSFSDNRMFDGKVYERVGFKLDGELKPDYYWVKGGKRHHKSGLRKTKEEKKSGRTEVELREAQGYARIWDLGKKRWVWRPGGADADGK